MGSFRPGNIYTAYTLTKPIALYDIILISYGYQGYSINAAFPIETTRFRRTVEGSEVILDDTVARVFYVSDTQIKAKTMDKNWEIAIWGIKFTK